MLLRKYNSLALAGHGRVSALFLISNNAMLTQFDRELQRKLSAEKQSFQNVLQQVRQSLAEQYLNETSIPIIEVSFLLGFQESNSFIRAYHSWTGQYPNQAQRLAGSGSTFQVCADRL